MFATLRLYSSEEEKLEEFLEALKEEGIENITVLQGIAGFGKGREFHTEDIEVLSLRLPVVIEAVSDKERIIKALERNKELFKDCFITLERTQVWEQF